MEKQNEKKTEQKEQKEIKLNPSVPSDALKILNNVLGQLKASRDEHIIFQNCLTTIKQDMKDTPEIIIEPKQFTK